jgi:hypothetical protein
VYSLVSASVLAIDLARHPSGAAVADVVDRVLALGPAEVVALRDPASDQVRQRVLGCAREAARAVDVLGRLEAGMGSAGAGRTLVEDLAAALVGDLDGLLAMLLREPPLRAAASGGAQVALDAVTAAWAGRRADLDDLAQLRRPWVVALAPVPPALPEAPYTADLRDLLDEVPRRTTGQWQRVVRAHRERRGSRAWSLAMHEACRAAFEADRLLEVARAQLAAARALRLSRASTGADAQAVAMAVTAAVQAVCTRDLLDTPALLRPWRAGS